MADWAIVDSGGASQRPGRQHPRLPGAQGRDRRLHRPARGELPGLHVRGAQRHARRPDRWPRAGRRGVEGPGQLRPELRLLLVRRPARRRHLGAPDGAGSFDQVKQYGQDFSTIDLQEIVDGTMGAWSADPKGYAGWLMVDAAARLSLGMTLDEERARGGTADGHRRRRRLRPGDHRRRWRLVPAGRRRGLQGRSGASDPRSAGRGAPRTRAPRPHFLDTALRDQRPVDEAIPRNASGSGRRTSPTRHRPAAGFPALPDLPLGRYTDPAFFELERRAPVQADRGCTPPTTASSPTPASYKLCDIVGAPVLLVRGDDGEVRAFCNSCRHRGAPVVRDACGTARLLVLPVPLVELRPARAPGARARRARLRRPATGRARPAAGALRAVGWVVLRQPRPDAMPLLEWLHPLPTLLADVARSPLRSLDVKTVELRCNWKILAEGFLEVYHARTVHPDDGRPDARHARHGDLAVRPRAPEHGVAGGAAAPAPTAAISCRCSTGARRCSRAMLQPAHGIFPNLITPLDGRGFPFLVFWPEAIDRTRLDIIWFAARLGRRRDARTSEIWRSTPRPLRRADAGGLPQPRADPTLDGARRPRRSGRQLPGAADLARARLDRQDRSGPSGSPPQLRVPDLLADWVERI